MLTQPAATSQAGFHYFDRHFKRPGIKVLPGEYALADDDAVLVTVLGSCVSACIRDRRRGIGGMNHFMLPAAGSGDDPASYSMRYGACAMEVLINELLKQGAVRADLEAKVFGGGHVMGGPTLHVGDDNADFVLDYLATEGIPVTASDLRLKCARKVAFVPATGEAFVRHLQSDHERETMAAEADYAHQLRKTPTGGTVDLF